MSTRNPALTALNKQVCSYDYDPSDARCHARKQHKIDRDSHHSALPRCTPAITPNCGAKVTLADKIVVPVDKLHKSRFLHGSFGRKFLRATFSVGSPNTSRGFQIAPARPSLGRTRRRGFATTGKWSQRAGREEGASQAHDHDR
jgi:hypothetical protein